MKTKRRGQAKIGEFKAHLSEYLRSVRAGQEVVVFDRDTPVARVIPADRTVRNGIILRPGKGNLKDLKFSRINLSIDLVQELLDERRREREDLL